MNFCDPTANGQTESGASQFACSRFVGAIETVKNAGRSSLEIPNAGIPDAYDCHPVFCCKCD